MQIVPLTPEHADEVLAIYRAGIDTRNATFASEAGTWEDFSGTRLPDHRWVALDDQDGRVLGWVTGTAISQRRAFRGVVEVSVYVNPTAHGQGVGQALLKRFISSTEAAGIWSIQSGIFPENTVSLALHRKVGFRVVGVREGFGEHDGVWRDVILLERRSELVGRNRDSPGN